MINSNLNEDKFNTKERIKEFVMASSTLSTNDVHDNDVEDVERTVGQGYYRLAKVYYDKSDLLKAEEFFTKALGKCVYPRDAFAFFKIYGFLIRIYSEKMQKEMANKYIAEAEVLLDKLSTDLGSLNAEFFYNAGAVANYKGDFEKALENFKIAYQKAGQENEPELVAKSLYFVAKSSYHCKNFNDALNFLTQLDELLSILKKGYLRGSMYMLYGHLYHEFEEYPKSLEYYDKAINILQGKGCWNLYGYILLEKGIVLKKMGDFSKSLIYFDLTKSTLDDVTFKRLFSLVEAALNDLNDSSVDLYLDRHHRMIHEKDLGAIDFKHRFVLLEILFLLAKKPGSSFGKEDLAQEIWKDEYNPLIHDKLIYTSISRLRKLIEPKGSARKYILRGKDGYTFNPRVNARFHKDNDFNASKGIGNIEINSPV